MSAYSITNPSEQSLRLLIKAGGGEETLLLQRPQQELRAQVALEPSGAKVVATLLIGDRTETMVLQAHDPANANHIADYLEALANGTAETAKAPVTDHAHPLNPCRVCGGEAISCDYVAEHDVWIHRIYCRYKRCSEVDGFESAAAARAGWNEQNPLANVEQPATPALDMVNNPPHYTGHPSGVECIEVAEHLPFTLGNAFKYLFRRDQKAETLENLRKAIWYMERHVTAFVDFQGLEEEPRDLLAQVAAREPYPISAVMMIIGARPQCGGYDAGITMLRNEAQRLASGGAPLLAA